MKAVLVFVFLSLLSGSLAARDLNGEIVECYARYPAAANHVSGEELNNTEKKFDLCIMEVLGLYEDGKFDVNRLDEEIKNQMKPEVYSQLQNIMSSVKGQDDADTAALIIAQMGHLIAH